MAGALFACRILRSLAKQKTSKEDREELLLTASFFEKVSLEILDQLHLALFPNIRPIEQILLRPVALLNNFNCLQLAEDAQVRKFFFHRECQALVGRIWYGQIKETSFWKVLQVTLFPPLLFRLKYHKKQLATTIDCKEFISVCFNSSVETTISKLVQNT